MALKALIFDLDGTLLDTLPDLTALTNAVMRSRGYPQHTPEKILTFIGSGARVLMRRAIPADVPDSEIEDLMQLWRSLYPQYGYALTKPYPGVPEALDELKAAGMKLGVLSNKFDLAAQEVIQTFFPGVFDAVRGEGPETPRKPDPAGLLSMAADLEVAPGEVGLVGDSGGTDMAAACAAGAFPIGVSWGYNSVDNLMEHGARIVVDDPAELVSVCLEP